MPIQNFEFPGVTLKQVFTESTYGTVSTLGAACVGPMYRLHRHNVAAEAAMIDQSTTAYSAESGLANIDIPNRSQILDESLDLTKSTHRLVVKNGIFSYPVTGATGTVAISDNLNKISFTFAVKDGNGYTASADFGSRGVKVGDPVVLTDTSDTTISHSTYVIAILPNASTSKYDTIAVASLGAFTAEDTPTVKFGVYADATYQESASTFAVNGTTEKLTIQGGLTTDLSSEFAVSSGTVTGTLQSGVFYFEYREKLNSYVGQLGVVSTAADAVELIGDAVPENPLAMAVYFAIQASAGNAVYFTSVRSDDAAGYTEALDFLDKYTTVYSVVPCTSDADIIRACAGSVVAASDDEHSKVRRALWYGIDTDAEINLYTGRTTAVAAAGSVLATVTFEGAAPFVDYPVQTGDIIVNTLNNARYSIRSTNYVNQASIAPIGSAPAIVAGSDLRFSYVRTAPTNAQVIQSVVAKRPTQNLRCRCVWADDILFNGEVVPNFCGAAAAAGMRSGEECWRPLSNLTYNFFSVKDTHGFTRSQLKEVGANGIWIIGNNNDGTPINMKAITTAMDNNVNTDNESIISNADEIALALCHVGENMVGNSNISDTLLLVLSDQISVMLRARMTNGTSALVGNQLISYTIVNVWQDESNKDEVYATIEIEPPKPFNQFHMTMRVI